MRAWDGRTRISRKDRGSWPLPLQRVHLLPHILPPLIFLPHQVSTTKLSPYLHNLAISLAKSLTRDDLCDNLHKSRSAAEQWQDVDT
ncbi:hypothetical protein Syun_011321 [Stephania yunnanensis]|uniref:Uncharacterized protein n=1 Tax=Stephania yunnanensis TaxID=152371 RepID=A0AAP0JXB2_9MAGN